MIQAHIHRRIYIALSIIVALFFITKTADAATQCSLILTSVPSSTAINSQEQVTYTYSLKNVGTVACVGTAVSLYYGNNETFVSGTPAPTASDYYWSIGRLARNQTSTFSVTIKNVSSDGTPLYGEACASGNGAIDSCVKTPVSTTISDPSSPPPVSNPNTASSTPSPISTPSIEAWIYPGYPACNAQNEYSDGRIIDTLKPEYFTVQTNGTLRQKTLALDGCNGYSSANAADIRAHSTHQFATVSGDIKNTRILFASPTLQAAAISTLTDFAVNSGFSGIELDWEGFGNWTATDYANFKAFTSHLADSLHTKNKLLMIDAPAISDPTYQSYYPFKYEDFSTADFVTIMAYDYQYDYGAGVSVTPDSWLTDIVVWAKQRLPIDKIIIGIPAYGYHGTLGSYSLTIDTFAQSSTYPGFVTRSMNSDGEETWTNGATFYTVQSTASLDHRKALLTTLGIHHVSVWHLGGNQWFTH